MADAVRKLGLQTNLTCCFQLNAGLLLRLRLGLDLLLEADHLVLLGLQELDLATLFRLMKYKVTPVTALNLSSPAVSASHPG